MYERIIALVERGNEGRVHSSRTFTNDKFPAIVVKTESIISQPMVDSEEKFTVHLSKT